MHTEKQEEGLSKRRGVLCRAEDVGEGGGEGEKWKEGNILQRKGQGCMRESYIGSSSTRSLTETRSSGFQGHRESENCGKPTFQNSPEVPF